MTGVLGLSRAASSSPRAPRLLPNANRGNRSRRGNRRVVSGSISVCMSRSMVRRRSASTWFRSVGLSARPSPRALRRSSSRSSSMLLSDAMLCIRCCAVLTYIMRWRNWLVDRFVCFWFRHGTAAVVKGIGGSLNIEMRKKKIEGMYVNQRAMSSCLSRMKKIPMADEKVRSCSMRRRE